MKAIVFASYGAPEVLRLVDLAPPAPAAGQVLIRVAAAGVNPADWRLRSGQFKRGMRLTLPFIPGHDVAGHVVAVGLGVSGFAVGDAVFAMTPLKAGGGYAEFAAVDAALVAPAPVALSLDRSAALPLAGLTALQALRDHGRLQSGQAVLVVGASGGVGHLAVQIASALGAQVSALCSARHEAFVRSIGATSFCDRADPASYAGPRRFDLVFDAVGQESFWRWRRMVRKGGAVVTVNPIIGRILPGIVTAAFGVSHLRSFFVKPGADDLKALKRLVDAGALAPAVEAQFPLGEAARAQQLSAAGRVRGKLVIKVAAA